MRQLLRPLFDRVIIKELEPDRVRQSGLVVPEGSREDPPQHGIVLAVGPGLDWWDQAGVRMPVQAGDHVVFPSSAGAWVDVEEERSLPLLLRPRASQRGPLPGVRARVGLGRGLSRGACLDAMMRPL
jgi:chaperonin GroES